jgi:hypothetical protein
MENSTVTPDINTQPERHHHHHRGRAWFPLILILAGIVILIQNLHLANFTFNWWALFIFIPVVGSLSAAWDGVREDSSFSAKVGGSLGSAVVIGTVGTILLFGLDWVRYWPLMVIAVGFSAFLTGLGRVDVLGRNNLSALTRLSVWVGLAAMVLGLGFLAAYLPIPALQVYLVARWWAIPILIAGFGAVMGALAIFWQNNREMNWAAWSMLLIAVFIIGVGLLALFALDWNLLFPIILIACGLVIMIGIFTRK